VLSTQIEGTRTRAGLLPAGTGAACGPPAAGWAGRLVPPDGDGPDDDWPDGDWTEGDWVDGDEAAGDWTAEDEGDEAKAGSLAEDGSSSRAPGALPGCAEIRYPTPASSTASTARPTNTGGNDLDRGRTP